MGDIPKNSSLHAYMKENLREVRKTPRNGARAYVKFQNKLNAKVLWHAHKVSMISSILPTQRPLMPSNPPQINKNLCESKAPSSRAKITPT